MLMNYGQTKTQTDRHTDTQTHTLKIRIIIIIQLLLWFRFSEVTVMMMRQSFLPLDLELIWLREWRRWREMSLKVLLRYFKQKHCRQFSF